jgi:predicted transcriptional regulator
MHPIEEIRRFLKMNQIDFAKAINRSQPHVSKIETWAYPPAIQDIHMLLKLASATGEKRKRTRDELELENKVINMVKHWDKLYAFNRRD